MSAEDIFGYQFEKVEQYGNATLLHMINKTGYGTLTYRYILFGLALTYDHIYMESFWKKLEKSKTEKIEINHCLQGKFAFEMDNGNKYFMNAGDICVYDSSFGNISKSSIPGKNYQGLSIIVEPEKAKHFLGVLGMNKDIDFELFAKKVQSERGPVLLSSSNVPALLIDELYFIENCDRNSLYVLKVVEFLLHLCDSFRKREVSFHKYSQDMLDAVRQVHDIILSKPMRKVTVSELSKEFLLPRTGFTQCFKEIYGMPPATFMRSVKMRVAAEELLKCPEISIREVASLVGYDNQSKFATAFKTQWGITPLSYKKINAGKNKQTEQKPEDME